eukprot:scaffold49222_cov20-Tisochrysis_lutea.AAC.2
MAMCGWLAPNATEWKFWEHWHSHPFSANNAAHKFGNAEQMCKCQCARASLGQALLAMPNSACNVQLCLQSHCPFTAVGPLGFPKSLAQIRSCFNQPLCLQRLAFLLLGT